MANRFALGRLVRTHCQILLTGIVLAGLAYADRHFSLISRRASAVYGASEGGGQRVDAWRATLSEREPANDLDLLQRVNEFFNRELRYVEDAELWGMDDYWANPVQSLWQGGGGVVKKGVKQINRVTLQHVRDSMFGGQLPNVS